MRQLLIVLALFVCISIEVGVNHANAARKHLKGDGGSVKVPSIPPIGLNCTPSLGGKKHGSGMEMVSRFGGCSKFDSRSNFSFVHILRQDRLRAASWTAGSNVKAASSLTSQSGLPIGYNSYYVTAGLGTPPKSLSLVFDTGSGLTWTQCKPCSLAAGLGSCYKQVDPIFNPAASSTYSNLGCSSNACLSYVTNNPDPCLVSADSCAYNISYGDGSFTAGFFAQETLTLTPTDALTGFQFGCGEQNEGLLNGIAGLIGLDRENVSIVTQASSKYGKYFSYCMPDVFSSSTGHLTLGQGGTVSTNITYTPLLINDQYPDFYFLGLQSIWVGGNKLDISADVFSNPGTLIDSGTTFSSLPPVAYTALLDAFTNFMDNKYYPSLPSSPGDAYKGCYNLTGIEGAVVPTISLVFNGGAQMDVHTWGIFYPVSSDSISDGKMEVCLAFTSNAGDSEISILGSMQTEKYDIVYDVDGGQIGFGANGC